MRFIQWSGRRKFFQPTYDKVPVASAGLGQQLRLAYISDSLVNVNLTRLTSRQSRVEPGSDQVARFPGGAVSGCYNSQFHWELS